MSNGPIETATVSLATVANGMLQTNGVETGDRYFLLNYSRDPKARAALKSYAQSLYGELPEASHQIHQLVIDSEKACECPVCKAYCKECGRLLRGDGSDCVCADERDTVDYEPTAVYLTPAGVHCSSCNELVHDGDSVCRDCGHSLGRDHTRSDGVY